MAIADTITSLSVGMFLYGLSLGLVSTLFGAFWAEVYGTRHLGTIKSLMTAAMVLGTAIGPGLTGFALDRGFHFSVLMQGMAIYFLLAFASTIFAIRLVKRREGAEKSLKDVTLC